MEKEIWKQLIYDNIDIDSKFEISNYGELRNKITNKVYKKHINKNGYYQVCVSLGSRKSKKVIRLHLAVAKTFIPNEDKTLIVNHKDCNKLNCCVDNLEWCSQHENVLHAYENGLITIGEKHRGSKLKEKDVIYIRKHYNFRDKDNNIRALASKFNVSINTIKDVVYNKTWRHI